MNRDLNNPEQLQTTIVYQPLGDHAEVTAIAERKAVILTELLNKKQYALAASLAREMATGLIQVEFWCKQMEEQVKTDPRSTGVLKPTVDSQTIYGPISKPEKPLPESLIELGKTIADAAKRLRGSSLPRVPTEIPPPDETTSPELTKAFVEAFFPSEEEDKGGIKFDQGKPQMSLLPFDALEEVARVLTFGAKKYGKDNWRKGMRWTRLIDAAIRHIAAFNKGETFDTETGLTHVAHATCCLLFLVAYTQTGCGEDDRSLLTT